MANVVVLVLASGQKQQAQAADTIEVPGLLAPATAKGIRGTTAADNPAIGSVGETITGAVAAASAVSLTTLTSVNVTSISLSAGDWDVRGNVLFTLASTTTMGYLYCGINTTSATLPTGPAGLAGIAGAGTNATTDVTLAPAINIAPVRINVSSTTTVYLIARAKFGTSTCKAYGSIVARRRR